MAGLLAALFTALLSNTIVSTALPTMMADLNGSQREYTWVITASLLMMTVSTPIWGKLSDQINKKFLVQLTIGLFVTGSLVAGIANSIPMMIGARVVQGLAMGGLMALVQAIMATVVSPRERGRWSGYMGGAGRTSFAFPWLSPRWHSFKRSSSCRAWHRAQFTLITLVEFSSRSRRPCP